MKVKKQQNPEFGEDIGFVSNKATITDANMELVFERLYSGYKDPIGSFIRELTSNCFDAHRKINNIEDPAIIKIDNDNIYFIDKGSGMSPKFMRDVYFNWLESDKRDSDIFLGAYGLGSKSPLSYVSEFKVITTYNEIKYTYLIERKGEDNLPSDTLLHEINVPGESNGTIVKVEIEQKDYEEIEKKLRTQLAYFSNVYVESNNFHINFQNEYKIHEFNNFKIRSDSPFTRLHICIDVVYYPIDFDLIDFHNTTETNHTIPIAIKFKIGELDITYERESIKYTDKSKEAIVNKLEEAYKELIYICNKSNSVSLLDAIMNSDYDRDSIYYKSISINNIYRDKIYKDHYLFNNFYNINYKPLIDFNFINYDRLLSLYEVYGVIKDNGDFKRLNRKTKYRTSIYTLKKKYLENDHFLFRITNKNTSSQVNRIKNLYIRDDEGLNISGHINLIRLRKLKYKNYKEILNIPGQKRLPYGYNTLSIIKKILKETNKMIIENSSSYSSLDIENFKKILKDRKRTIAIGTEYELLRYNYNENIWVTRKIDYNMFSNKEIIIYGHRNSSQKLNSIYNLLYKLYRKAVDEVEKICIIRVRKTMYKQLEQLNNTIEVSDFLFNSNVVSKKIVCSFYATTILENPNYSKVLLILKELSPIFYDKVMLEYQNSKKYLNKYEHSTYWETLKDDYLKSIINSLINEMLNNKEIPYQIKTIRKFHKFAIKYPLLYNIEYNAITIPVIVDYLKKNIPKLKLDIIWYNDLKYQWEIELFNEIKNKITYLKSIGKEIKPLNYFTYVKAS